MLSNVLLNLNGTVRIPSARLAAKSVRKAESFPAIMESYDSI
jgi:hypothetical protein